MGIVGPSTIGIIIVVVVVAVVVVIFTVATVRRIVVIAVPRRIPRNISRNALDRHLSPRGRTQTPIIVTRRRISGRARLLIFRSAVGADDWLAEQCPRRTGWRDNKRNHIFCVVDAAE